MDRNNATFIFYVTDKGLSLARKLLHLYQEAEVLKFSPKAVSKAWNSCGSILFITAAGIAVRTIAPLIENKKTDPAVIVIDEKGKFAVSLLSGHLGGANNRASEIAAFLKGTPVITTASDVNNLTPIDLWAKRNALLIDDWKLLPKIGTRLLNKGSLKIYTDQDTGINMPDEFIRTDDPVVADLLITNRTQLKGAGKGLYLRPKNLVIGLGCNSGTSAREIEDAVRKTLAEHNLAFSSIHSIATINKKKDEPGLVAFADRNGFPLDIFSPEELNRVATTKSEAAFKATGAHAVSEPAALLAAHAGTLLVSKQKAGNVTIAAAEINKSGRAEERKAESSEEKKVRVSGSLHIVGTGPGNASHITPHAMKAIREADVIVGYGTYLDLIQEIIKDKEVVSTGMTQEIDRCKKAVELALEGRKVAVISGGDPGIYAMAGLVFETLKKELLTSQPLNLSTPLLSVEVIPGISALNACASRLGAPLMHDFASISLSDRLTPWDLIEKRLDAAASADFVIALYNPKSRGRAEHINRAREIILGHRKPDTPVGIVKGAMREDEKIVITDLAHMLEHEIDMQTTVIIGNSKTFVWESWLITPRGYEKKLRG